MLSIFGSKARIVQAHMSTERQRLQVRFSEFFDFHNLTKQWLDVFVRWMLNEPLLAPSLSSEVSPCEGPESSEDKDGSLVSASSGSQMRISDEPRSQEYRATPQKPLSRPVCSPGCKAEELNIIHTMLRSPPLLEAQ